MDKFRGVYRKTRGVKTTPYVSGLQQVFRVIHPFHPLYKQEFTLVQYRRSWGAAYLDYKDKAGKYGCIPLEWTDAGGVDVFLEVSRGRSYFRIAEILRLVELMEGLRECKGDSV